MGELEQSVYRRGRGHWVNWNMVCVRGKGGNWCSETSCVLSEESSSVIYEHLIRMLYDY